MVSVPWTMTIAFLAGGLAGGQDLLAVGVLHVERIEQRQRLRAPRNRHAATLDNAGKWLPAKPRVPFSSL
jgi:hypothetical protein